MNRVQQKTESPGRRSHEVPRANGHHRPSLGALDFIFMATKHPSSDLERGGNPTDVHFLEKEHSCCKVEKRLDMNRTSCGKTGKGTAAVIEVRGGS